MYSLCFITVMMEVNEWMTLRLHCTLRSVELTQPLLVFVWMQIVQIENVHDETNERSMHGMNCFETLSIHYEWSNSFCGKEKMTMTIHMTHDTIDIAMVMMMVMVLAGRSIRALSSATAAHITVHYIDKRIRTQCRESARDVCLSFAQAKSDQSTMVSEWSTIFITSVGPIFTSSAGARGCDTRIQSTSERMRS